MENKVYNRVQVHGLCYDTHSNTINLFVPRENIVKNKNQLDATCYFIVLLIGSTCFEHYYAHHQELVTMFLVTTLVVSFLVC